MNKVKTNAKKQTKKFINKLTATGIDIFIYSCAALFLSKFVTNIDPKWSILIGVAAIGAMVYIKNKTSQDAK